MRGLRKRILIVGAGNAIDTLPRKSKGSYCAGKASSVPPAPVSNQSSSPMMKTCSSPFLDDESSEAKPVQNRRAYQSVAERLKALSGSDHSSKCSILQQSLILSALCTHRIFHHNGDNPCALIREIAQSPYNYAPTASLRHHLCVEKKRADPSENQHGAPPARLTNRTAMYPETSHEIRGCISTKYARAVPPTTRTKPFSPKRTKTPIHRLSNKCR